MKTQTKDEIFAEMFGTPQAMTEREKNQLRAGEKFLLGAVVSKDLMTPEEKFFAAEKSAGTLAGAIHNDPAAAVRVLGPLQAIIQNCGQ